MIGRFRALMRLVILFTLLPLGLPAWSDASEERVVSIHADRATPKLLFYDEGYGIGPEGAPEQQALAYLGQHYARFELPQDLANLERVRIEESLLGTHVHYQQFIHGIPVEHAEIIVTIGKARQGVTMVFNNTYPQAGNAPDQGKLSLAIGREAALDIAWNHLRAHGELMAPPTARLVYLPEESGFRLIYRTDVYVEAPFGYWEHGIDALTGEVIEVRNAAIDEATGSTEDSTPLFDAYDGPIWPRAQTVNAFLEREAEERALRQERAWARVAANGTADVFDPDPRTTLQDATIEDTDPAATFTNAYINRTLQDINNDSGTWRLEGPWVAIMDFELPNTAPSTTTNGNWTAHRGDNAFNDVMSYFHIDQNQRYIQSLGFTGASGIQDGPIGTDSDGQNGNDNSHYVPSTNRLAFGHGCVDDNEDADVILHEYGHAIQFDINGSWFGGDTGAMGEGFGDYWAGSYSYSTPNGPNFHPEWMFSWDGHNACWGGRVMDRLTYEYDPHSTYLAHTTVNGVLGDELWSTPLFQAFLDLIGQGRPRTEMDKIILQSHFGLGANLTMPDLAAATVSAAQSLYPAGPHSLVYAQHFGHHNILATYVDASWVGVENGTVDNPYNTLTEGATAVTAGARVNMEAGNYTGSGNSPIVIDKAMTIQSRNGGVVIGN